MRARRSAFTLVELLLVIAIIGVLISLVVQGGQAIRAAANRANCQGNLKGLANAYFSYISARDGQYPPYWDPEEHSYSSGGNDQYMGSMPMVPNYYIVGALSGGGRTFSIMFGPLVFEGFVKDADLFVCPTIQHSGYAWWSEDQKGDTPWFHGTKNNKNPIGSFEDWHLGNRTASHNSYSSYCLRPGLYPKSETEVAKLGIKAFLADNFHFHYTDEKDWEYDVIRQRHGTGVNVAYLDGTVTWREDPILFTGNYDRPTTRTLSQEGGMTDGKIWKIWSSFDKVE